MSEAATPAAPAEAGKPSTAENVTPTPPAGTEPGGSAADSPTPEGAPAVDPTPKPEAPNADKLTRWSQKLTRREEKQARERAEFDKEKAAHAALVESGKLFENKQLRPIIEAYAKKHGVSFEDSFNALTREVVAPGEKTVDEIVEEKLAKERQATAAANEQQKLENWQRQSHAYIGAKLPQSDLKYLKSYDKDYIAKFAVDVATAQYKQTGKHESLDKILADMNAAEEKRYNLHRQLDGDSQITQNPERESGAVEPAKHESRKRNGSQLNNSHAAEKPSNGAGKEDLSDKALAAAAAKALRSIPGWH